MSPSRARRTRGPAPLRAGRSRSRESPPGPQAPGQVLASLAPVAAAKPLRQARESWICHMGRKPEVGAGGKLGRRVPRITVRRTPPALLACSAGWQRESPVRSREGAHRRSGCQDVKTQLPFFEVYK